MSKQAGGLLIAASAALLASAPALAQDATWTGAAGDFLLNTGSNWSTGTRPAGVATFGDGPRPYAGLNENGGPKTFGSMRFTGSSGYVIDVPEYLTLDGAGIVTASGTPAPYFDVGGDFGRIYFENSASAGSATIRYGGLAGIYFNGTSSGGTARFILNGVTPLDISGLTSGGMSIGSVEGQGRINLGAKTLTLGGNNLSTIWNGIFVGTGGAVTKEGSGTFIITGDNTNTGGFAVTGGTLQIGNNGTSGNVLGTVFTAGSGLFALARSDNFTFANQIIGSGGVVMRGSGTTTFSGSNTYSGPTIIESGTLVASGGSAIGLFSPVTIYGSATLRLASTESIGSLAGAGFVQIPAGMTLSVGENGASTTYAGFISGAGRLLLNGGGLTLTGVSSYSGGTRISGGTLTVASNNAVGSGTLDLGFISTLAYAPGVTLDNNIIVSDTGAKVSVASGSATQAGSVSGPQLLTKTGAGSLDLNGPVTLGGGLVADQGRVAVNGALNGEVVVNAGATLGGHGSVSSIDVYGGVIAPGNSIGTLSVAGPATFHAGSTFEVELNGRGEGDRLAVGGVATLAGQVHVIPQFGLYALATDYKIITAASLAGQFDGVTSDLAFLVPSLRYSAQDVMLHLDRNGNAFGTFAGTPNQVFVAEAAERLGAGNAVFNALLGLSIPQAQQAFAQLSGDVHGGAPALIQTGSGLFTTALTDRLWIGQSSAFQSSAEPLTTGAIPGAAAVPVRDLDPQHFALWGEALGAIGQAKGGGGSAGLDQSTAGFALGADVGVDDWRLGVAGGFTRTNFDTSGGLQSGDVDSVHGALYGAAAFGQVRLRTGTSFASADIAATRTITIPGISGSYRADYNGRTYQVFAEAGYRFDLAGMLAEFGAAGLEPFVKGTFGRAVTDRFAEEGGAAALVGFANDATFSTTTLGVHADLQPSSTSPLTLRATLGWRHAFGEVAPNVLLAFRDGGSAFAIAGAPADRDALAAQMNVGWTFNRSMRFDLTYAGVLGQNAQEHSASGHFSMRF